MIWHRGRIVDKSEVVVDLDDRVFEHGLGLFETLRTWNGRASLLPRHLDRLCDSARNLGLDLAGGGLPDQAAVCDLLTATGLGPDAMLRITMTGGVEARKPPVLWMTARPLPARSAAPVKVVLFPHDLHATDPLRAHKSLNYWSRRLAHSWAESVGAVDCLFRADDGRLLEASRHNVLIVPRDLAATIATPSLDGSIVPGIMRATVLDFARASGYRIEERSVSIDELLDAEAVYLTNSVRGVRRVGQCDATSLDLLSRQDLTDRLVEALPRHLSIL